MIRAPVPSNEPSRQPPGDEEGAPSRRLFLSERGWKVRVKTDSDREFCYMMAPGQDFYHRLLDGEIFLARDDEKLCLDCAVRRGLITRAPKRLRDAIVAIPADMEAIPLELAWRDDDRSSEPSFHHR